MVSGSAFDGNVLPETATSDEDPPGNSNVLTEK